MFCFANGVSKNIKKQFQVFTPFIMCEQAAKVQSPRTLDNTESGGSKEDKAKVGLIIKCTSDLIP